jgi:hypothetical protein
MNAWDAALASRRGIAAGTDGQGNCVLWNSISGHMYRSLPQRNSEREAWVSVHEEWQRPILERDSWLPVQDDWREWLLGFLFHCGEFLRRITGRYA